MLYTFTKYDQLPSIPEINGLEIREIEDPLFISILNLISIEEATRRLGNDHKAYVAYIHNVPAAFGWVAAGKAKIGELNHEFILPENNRYLWNFRTLEKFRGLGIYPRLLQFIIKAELAKSECFWILHAPENHASQRGILKAGFKFIGEVSVLKERNVQFTLRNTDISLEAILETFGFTISPQTQASCWNCSSPYLKNKNHECCCSANDTTCTQNIYKEILV